MESCKMEAFLRILSTVFLVLTAFLVGFDTETKLIFHAFPKKATFKDLNVLYFLVWIVSAAAAYNLIQLFRSYIQPGCSKDPTASYNRCLAWAIYLLDQAATYLVFAANTAATQGSILAVTGEKSFQWLKLCNIYTRFCHQIGGALLCGYIAVILMIITSSITAYALFRLYSPKQFLLLKGT